MADGGTDDPKEPAKLRFEVAYVSTEHEDYPATELNQHTPHTKGWQTDKFCEWPAEIGLRFADGAVHVTQVQLLSHQYKIATKIELYAGRGSTYESAKWKRLGYLSLDSNERSKFKAREIKSVYIDARCAFLRLKIHKCHVNAHNMFQQVGIVAINVLGTAIEGAAAARYMRHPSSARADRPAEEPAKEPAHTEPEPGRHDRNEHSRQSSRHRPSDHATAAEPAAAAAAAEEEEEGATPAPRHHRHRRGHSASSGRSRTSTNSNEGGHRSRRRKPRHSAGSGRAGAAASDAEELAASLGMDDDTAALFVSAVRAKKDAVRREDYMAAQRFKQTEDAVRAAAPQLARIEADKERAVAEERYADAAQLKQRAVAIRAQLKAAVAMSAGGDKASAANQPAAASLAGMPQPTLYAQPGMATGAAVYGVDPWLAPEGRAIGGDSGIRGGETGLEEGADHADPKQLEGVDGVEELPAPEPVAASKQAEADAVAPVFGEYVARCLASKHRSLREAALKKVEVDLGWHVLDERSSPAGVLRCIADTVGRIVAKDKISSVLAGACGLLPVAVRHALDGGQVSQQEAMRACSGVLAALTNKLADNGGKNRLAATDCLLACAELLGPAAVANAVCAPLPKKQASGWRALHSRLSVLTSLVRDQALLEAGVSAAALVSFSAANKAHDNKNGQLRNAARDLVVELHKSVGNPIMARLGHLNPKQKKEYLEAMGLEAPGAGGGRGEAFDDGGDDDFDFGDIDDEIEAAGADWQGGRQRVGRGDRGGGRAKDPYDFPDDDAGDMGDEFGDQGDPFDDDSSGLVHLSPDSYAMAHSQKYSMRPLLLSSHDRSLTRVKYSHDGKWLFSLSKDGVPTMWNPVSGDRVGTFESGPYELWKAWREEAVRQGNQPAPAGDEEIWVGHGRANAAAVWDCEVTRDSQRLLVGGAGGVVINWRTTDGKPEYRWSFAGVVRGIALNEGDTQLAVVTERFAATPARLQVLPFHPDKPADCPAGTDELEKRPIWSVDLDRKPIRVLWAPANIAVLVCNDNGELLVLNGVDGALQARMQIHKPGSVVTDMQFNAERSLLATSSSDMSAKLWDLSTTLAPGPNTGLLISYDCDGPLNSVAIHPKALAAEEKDRVEIVLMGGGQEARDVTTTASGAGKFEARVHHLSLGDELGKISGHFGPINTLAFHPSGESYASGGEDGYIRVHQLPAGFFDLAKAATRPLQDDEVGQGREVYEAALHTIQAALCDEDEGVAQDLEEQLKDLVADIPEREAATFEISAVLAEIAALAPEVAEDAEPVSELTEEDQELAMRLAVEAAAKALERQAIELRARRKAAPAPAAAAAAAGAGGD